MTKVAHDSETLADGQQVFTACAFIHHDFDGVVKVFMPRRAATKKFLPGVFELPGGHIDFGEDMKLGLAREVAEEFGMEIKIGDPFGVFTYTNPVKRSHSIEVIYFATFTSSYGNIVLHPEDHSEFLWVAEDEISKITSVNKDIDDDEIRLVQKGFELLKGDSLDFGN